MMSSLDTPVATAGAIPFTKMHGIGNDYVYVDGGRHPIDDPPALARAISDRHFGVGSDGLILVLPPDDPARADIRMRMFNADGSEAEMCGNGVRCVCKYAFDRALTTASPMRIQTGAGVLSLTYVCDDLGRVERVRVDMGTPERDLDRLPVVRSAWPAIEALLPGSVVVGMGNPHLVGFVSDVHAAPLTELGPQLETHPAFPERINVHLVEVHCATEVTMRTWERGSGVTLACGTGAAAVCVAGAVTQRTSRDILAHLPGGDLELSWDESTDHVFMTGGASTVFDGTWSPS